MKATTPDDFKELEIWKNMLHDLQDLTKSKIDFLIHRINYIESGMKYKNKESGMKYKKDKEILRKKLIKDFEDNVFCMGGVSGYTESKMVMHLTGIKDIINRNFKVKKEKKQDE